MKIYNPSGTEIADLIISDESYRYRQIMGEKSVTLKVKSSDFTEIPIGSWIEYQNEVYTILSPQSVVQNNTKDFDTTLIFEASHKLLSKYKFRDTSGRLKFTMTGKAVDFLRLLVTNLNGRDSGWSEGVCLESNEKTLSFNHVYCSEALRMVVEEFETEYDISGKVISIGKVEFNIDAPLALSYGKGNGFKSGVKRSNADNYKPVERLFVQGGEKNINASVYGSKELRLPISQTLEYKGRTYITDSDGVSITRADKPLATNFEDSIDCSHIYPKRIGTVSQVIEVNASKNFYDFEDMNIPPALDYNNYLIPGEEMRVIFQTGMLAGREFRVSYTHNGRRFAIVPQEYDGQVMPNNPFKPALDDTYAVFGIALPNEYVCLNSTKEGASWDMFREAVAYMYDNEDQRFSFSGELDGIFAKTNWLTIGSKIILGGYISFTAQFQPTPALIRIVGIKDYICKPYSPVIELSNVTAATSLSSALGKIDSNEVYSETRNTETLHFAKRGFREAKNTAEALSNALLNFSAEVNPVSVQTMQVLLGDESLQFRFVDNKTTPSRVDHVESYNSETDKFTCAAGIIQHMTLGITDVSSSHDVSEYKFWDMAAYESPVLSGFGLLYLYAKCSKETTEGTFELSETAKGMESETGFYHFLVGILNAEFDNDRSYAPVYGFTEILPGRITTDKIISQDGTTYFDLLNGVIKGNISFKSGADYKEVGQAIEDAKTAAIEQTEAYADTLTENLQAQIDGVVDSWFYAYVPTPVNYPASEWTTPELKARHVGDTFTNTQAYVDDATTPNAGKSWRWVESAGVYSWTPIADSDAVKALLAAAQAKDVADGKRRVFTSQPTTASIYDVGDLWVNATYESIYNNDLLRCKTAKAAGTAFSINHWEKASDYTNDDTALEAISQIAGIEIGGRNLVKKSDYFTLYNHLGVEASLTEQETTYKGEKIWQLSMTPTVDTLTHFQTEESAHGVRTGVQKTFYANRPYIQSIYWKPISHADVSVGLLASNIGGWQALGTQAVGGGWYRTIASRTGTTDAVDFLSIAFKCPSATAGTPIVIQWACPQLEVGTKVTDYKAAPEDDRALIAAYSYLREALGLSTDVSGGLVATSVVLLRNALSQVVGGLSGISGNEGFWMGGTYEDYVAEIADVFIKSGKSRFKGEIIADSGLIGGILHILGNALTSKYFKISDEEILSKANATGLLTATINAIQAGTMLSLTQESPTAVFESNEVEIECRTLLPTVYWGHKYTEMHSSQRPRIYMANENSSCSLMLKIEVLNNGVVVAQNQRSWLYDYNGGSENPYSQLTANYWYLEKGTVKIRVTAQITSILNFDENSSFKFWHLLSGSLYGSITNIAIQHYHKRTEIGGNGFYSFWDTAKYLYYSAQEGLHLKGFTNLPGVLAAGKVTTAGAHELTWGAKKAIAGQVVTKDGTGKYIVPHNIGHSDYSVQASLNSSTGERLHIAKRNTDNVHIYTYNSSGALADAGFDYMIVGNN